MSIRDRITLPAPPRTTWIEWARAWGPLLVGLAAVITALGIKVPSTLSNVAMATEIAGLREEYRLQTVELRAVRADLADVRTDLGETRTRLRTAEAHYAELDEWVGSFHPRPRVGPGAR
jgi:hypothetical protein